MEWNGGMDWSTGVDYWSAMPTILRNLFVFSSMEVTVKLLLCLTSHPMQAEPVTKITR